MASRIMTGGPRSSWSHRRVWSSQTRRVAGSTARHRAALNLRSIGCLSTERQSAMWAAFVESCGTGRLCCCRSQPPPTARTSTAPFTDASQQTASVGLFRATFKCELVSSANLKPFLAFCSFPFNLKERHLKHDSIQPFLSAAAAAPFNYFPVFMYFSSSSTCVPHFAFAHSFALPSPRSPLRPFQKCIDVEVNNHARH